MAGQHLDCVACYYIPSGYDMEEVALVAYTIFHDGAPCDTGFMRDGIEYEIDEDGRLLWFTDSVVYAHYQDTRTSNAGWFEDGSEHGVDIALATCDPHAEDKEYEDIDWSSDW